MLKIFAKSIFSFMVVLLLLSVIHIGCSSRHLEQNPVERYYEESAPAYSLEQSEKNATEQRQKTLTSAKSKETSIFTVIELEDLEHPTLAASIRLPFRVGPNNTVVLAGKHAYLTTERHLHVIDVSIPQRPSYLTSLAFPDKIGKVLAADDFLVVASRKKFHLVNVSQPSVPVLQSTVYLPERDAIKDFDVKDAHLYVIGANNAVSIFSLHRGQARLVKTVELEKRWWLLSLKAVSPDVKQIPLSTTSPFPSVLSEPLASQRGFLQLSSSRQEKVRASSEFLVLESLRDPTCDLLTFHVHRENDPRALPSITLPNIDYDVGFYNGYMGFYNVGRQCHDHLSATRDKTLTRGKPTITYIVDAGKMQQIAQDPSSEVINIEDRRLTGPVTDFQMSGDLLYVVNAKGFFSVKRLHKPERDTYRYDQFLSVIPLQASRPMSLAVGEGFACVLATPKD